MGRLKTTRTTETLLVLVGLAIQIVSLPRSHPLTFSLFLLGAAITVAGTLLFVGRLLRGGWGLAAEESPPRDSA